MIENILNHFLEEWPRYYFLADFILSHLVNYPTFYYNYNLPDWFSLEGKLGKLHHLFDFITCVANNPDINIFKEPFKILVVRLIEDGAPSSLFKECYLREDVD